jgi:ribonuclease P protein component
LIRGAKISLVFAKNTRGKQRFAVIVSKKVLKSAVGRNRIRRRVYEVLRATLPKINGPVDCLVMVFASDVETMDFKDLQEILLELLKKAGVVI